MSIAVTDLLRKIGVTIRRAVGGLTVSSTLRYLGRILLVQTAGRSVIAPTFLAAACRYVWLTLFRFRLLDGFLLGEPDCLQQYLVKVRFWPQLQLLVITFQSLPFEKTEYAVSEGADDTGMTNL